MSGGGKGSTGDLLKQFQQASPGQGADNPQATPVTPATAPSLAPWAQQMQMGGQMMNAGRMPMQQHPMMQRPMMQGGATGMNMPSPLMQPQQQGLTTQGMNQLLAQRIGLMGRQF